MKSRVVVEVTIPNMTSGEAAWFVQDRLSRCLEVSDVEIMESEEVKPRRTLGAYITESVDASQRQRDMLRSR
jgi:hypothetical protein